MLKKNLIVVFLIILLLCLVLTNKSHVAGAEHNSSESKMSLVPDIPQRIIISGAKCVAAGLSIRLNVEILPIESSQLVIWKSSNTKIATVSPGGVVTGIKKGSVEITCYSAVDLKIKAVYKIKVKSKPVSKIVISGIEDQEIKLGSSIKLTAKASPKGAAQSFIWTSNCSDVVSVENDGTLRVLHPGKATISVSATDGSNVSSSFSLSVINDDEIIFEGLSYKYDSDTEKLILVSGKAQGKVIIPEHVYGFSILSIKPFALDGLIDSVDSIKMPSTLTLYTKKIIERGSLYTDQDDYGTNIRIGSYNICHYNNDTKTYISETKLNNLRMMLDEVDADVWCIQEDRKYLDGESKGNSYYTLFKDRYSYYYGDRETTIRSKYQAVTSGELTFSNGRWLRYAVFDIDKKKVLVVSTHPVAGKIEFVNARKIQYGELFDWIEGKIPLNQTGTKIGQYVPEYTHCIIGLDANCLLDEDKSMLLSITDNNRYNLTNGKDGMWFDTVLRSPKYSVDNIIVSNNIKVKSFGILTDLYEKLYSDHIPIYADVLLE